MVWIQIQLLKFMERMKMTEELNKEKLDQMWRDIIRFEQDEGSVCSYRIAVSKIEKIIAEVQSRCY